MEDTEQEQVEVTETGAVTVEPDTEDFRSEIEAVQADRDHWKQIARKQESRAKENASAHERVTELEAELADAKKMADAMPGLVAESLRTHLIDVHQIDTETADALLTANTPEGLLAQVKAVQGLSGSVASAPLEGTSEGSEPNQLAQYARELFSTTP